MNRAAITEQAAEWFIRVGAPDCPPELRAAFERWLAQDPSHRTEYRQLELLWKRLDQLPSQRKGRRRTTISAVALVAALTTLAVLDPPLSEQHIATSIGEQRHTVLPDGTELDVGPGSSVHVAYGLLSRRVDLESGEACFEIAADRWRAFEVRAGEGRIRDIGTRFEVANESGRVSIGVADGSVEVRLDGQLAKLHAGQQVSYDAHGLGAPTALDGAAVGAWRQGRWVFDDMRLDEVVARMNRQYSHPVALDDAALSDQRISGAFGMADRDSLLRAISTLHPMRQHEQDGITHLKR